jgi:hypothetical protein
MICLWQRGLAVSMAPILSPDLLRENTEIKKYFENLKIHMRDVAFIQADRARITYTVCATRRARRKLRRVLDFEGRSLWGRPFFTRFLLTTRNKGFRIESGQTRP